MASDQYRDSEKAALPAENGDRRPENRDPDPGSAFTGTEKQERDPGGNDTAPQDDPSAGRYLKNPLPVPRRRPHVKMEFDLSDDWDIPPEAEHYDYEVAEDDDFDI